MYALVQQGIVRQVAENTFVVHPDYQWVECDNTVSVDDLWNGTVFTKPNQPVKTIDEVMREYTDALQLFLDKKARERQYDNAISLATYTSSTNAQWKAEADAFVAWRDAVYVYALSVLDSVQQGGQQPTIDDFIAGLPAIAWP